MHDDRVASSRRPAWGGCARAHRWRLAAPRVVALRDGARGGDRRAHLVGRAQGALDRLGVRGPVGAGVPESARRGVPRQRRPPGLASGAARETGASPRGGRRRHGGRPRRRAALGPRGSACIEQRAQLAAGRVVADPHRGAAGPGDAVDPVARAPRRLARDVAGQEPPRRRRRSLYPPEVPYGDRDRGLARRGRGQRGGRRRLRRLHRYLRLPRRRDASVLRGRGTDVRRAGPREADDDRPGDVGRLLRARTPSVSGLQVTPPRALRGRVRRLDDGDGMELVARWRRLDGALRPSRRRRAADGPLGAGRDARPAGVVSRDRGPARRSAHSRSQFRISVRSRNPGDQVRLADPACSGGADRSRGGGGANGDHASRREDRHERRRRGASRPERLGKPDRRRRGPPRAARNAAHGRSGGLGRDPLAPAPRRGLPPSALRRADGARRALLGQPGRGDHSAVHVRRLRSRRGQDAGPPRGGRAQRPRMAARRAGHRVHHRERGLHRPHRRQRRDHHRGRRPALSGAAKTGLLRGLLARPRDHGRVRRSAASVVAPRRVRHPRPPRPGGDVQGRTGAGLAGRRASERLCGLGRLPRKASPGSRRGSAPWRQRRGISSGSSVFSPCSPPAWARG